MPLVKIFIASLSLTSLLGLWNLFSKDDKTSGLTSLNDSPQDLTEDIFNAPLPTVAPSVLQEGSGSQTIIQVTPQAIQPTPIPVIEKVVIGSSGRSGGSPSTKTSSSR